jgi:hypothetical protein
VCVPTRLWVPDQTLTAAAARRAARLQLRELGYSVDDYEASAALVSEGSSSDLEAFLATRLARNEQSAYIDRFDPPRAEWQVMLISPERPLKFAVRLDARGRLCQLYCVEADSTRLPTLSLAESRRRAEAFLRDRGIEVEKLRDAGLEEFD